jgi:hypothetical protein
VGDFTTSIITPEIEIDVEDASDKRHPPRRYRKKCPVWVVSMTPAPDIIRPHKAITNFINGENYGCGLILIRDAVLNTTALLCCEGVPYEKWKRLVDEITDKEGESIEPGEGNPEDCGCWHIQKNPGGYGNFILNGNKAHQYVPRSALDAAALCELVKRTFYS